MAVKVPERPYPTIGEIYRSLAVALGTKNRNPDVDRMARTGDYDYRLRDKLANDLFRDPLCMQVNSELAALFCKFIDRLVTEYINLVNRIALDAMSRDESLPLLAKHFFARQGASFLILIYERFNGPNPVNYCPIDDKNLMGVTCEWLEQNVRSFSPFLKHLDKGKQDQYRRWKQAKELPKVSSFTTFLEEFPESQDRRCIIIHLTVARVIQFFVQQCAQYNLLSWIREAIWRAEQLDLGAILSQANLEAAKQFSDLLPVYIETAHALRRSTPKNDYSKSGSWSLLERFDEQITRLDKEGVIRHFLEWQKARWYVYAGEYKQALKQYERAFEFTIYRAHYLSQGQGLDLNLHEILKEALALAAKERARPLLKRLKNQAIAFGIYEIPEKNDKLSKANKKSKNHVVEDWEVEHWDSAFSHLFKPENCFPGCIDEEKHRTQIPFLHHIEDKHFLRTPDLVNPNRRIDVGVSIGGEKRRYPQLIWHTDKNHHHHVKSLLDAGAKVDQLSDTSDSALLLATIEIENTGDRRCFDLIKQYPHKHETMNMRTDKKKLTILLAAIETGQLDIVKTVLDMGAEVDRRGNTDHSTALNQCTKHIGSVKNPDQAFANMLHFDPNDPVVIDTVRRTTHGMMGLTEAEVRKNLIRSMQDNTYRTVQVAAFKHFHEQQQKRFNYRELLQIAKLLLDRGASPDAIHKSPLPGYTPLMLAVELDDPELVLLMLQKGGNPYRTYQYGSHRSIDCWRIAREFRSYRALAVLERHRH